MKKLIYSLILIILLFPLTCFASGEVEVKSISLLEKSDNTKVNTEASTDGEKINLDLFFYDVDDYATYKVVVKNTTNTNLFINDDYFNKDKENIKYYFDFLDGSNIVKAGEEKTFNIKVIYEQEVDKSLFKNSNYDASLNEPLILSDKLVNVPNTLKNLGILGICISIIAVLCFATLIFILFKNKRNTGLNILLIGFLLLMIPSLSDALLRVDIPIDSKINIKLVKPNDCTYEGNLVQGAQYINGQYTYRYKQQSYGSSWGNIDNDGWGVALTDKGSSEAVTTKLCSSINGKPIVSMNSMFMNSNSREIDLSSFDTSNVTNMDYMFNNTRFKNIDLMYFDTSNVVTMIGMFKSVKACDNITVKDIDTSKVVSTYEMFYYAGTENASSTITVSNLDLSSATDLTYMFYYSVSSGTNVNLSVSNISAPNARNVYNMFQGVAYSVGTSNIKIENIDLSAATSASYLFAYIANSGGDANIVIKNINLKSFTGNQYSQDFFMSIGYNFQGKFRLTIDSIDLSKLQNTRWLFYNYGYNSSDSEITINNITLNSTNSFSEMFSYTGSSAAKMKLTVSNIKSTSATLSGSTFQYTGQHCRDLTVVVKDWDTPNLTSTSYMFDHMGQGATNNYDLTIKNLTTSNVTNMSYMFFSNGETNTGTFKIKFDNFNTSNVTNMRDMFIYTAVASSSVTFEGFDQFDYSKVTDMTEMFYHAFKHAIVDIGTIDIYNANTTSMFLYCYGVKATLNLHNGLNSYNAMFSSSTSLEGSSITVNYSNLVNDIDSIIATKSDYSNVIKGELID